MTIHTFAQTKKDAEVFDRLRIGLPVSDLNDDYEALTVDFEGNHQVFFCKKDRSSLKDE